MVLAEVWTTQRIAFKVHTATNNHSQQVKYSNTAAAADAAAYSLPVTSSQEEIKGRGGGVVGVGDGDGDENLIELVVEVTAAE